MKTEGFPKSERIVSKKLIDELFNSDQSHSLTAFPLRAVWMSLPQPFQKEGIPAQVLFSVPKRRFRHAVDRNRLKRQMREAYRHNKHLLSDTTLYAGQNSPTPLEESQGAVLIAFVWLSDQHASSAQIEKKVVQLLKRITAKIQSTNPNTP